MATQEDKERNLPPAAPASTVNTAKETDTKPDEGKDPDLYDPVGMAGKKAGIVQELEQEGTDASKGTPAGSNATGGAPAPEGPKQEGA